MENTETMVRRTNGRLPVGYRRVRGEDGWKVEPDPDKEFGLRLAFALYATGKMSVREICVEAAKHGLLGADSKALRPATMWRLLQRSNQPKLNPSTQCV